jgi:glycyl-tRNA synthetase beta chain
MGRIYALEQGASAPVAQAIEMHYWPRFNGDPVPSTQEAALVALADRVDTLCGIIGIGKTPKGSADPFGLRRASIGLIQIMMAHDVDVSLSDLISEGIALLGERIKGDAAAVQEQVLGFIRARLPGILQEHCENAGLMGVRDILGGAIEAGSDNIPDLWARTHALASLRDAAKEDFGVLAATFKRVGNIVRKAKEEGQYTDASTWDATSLVEPAEKALWDSFSHMQSKSSNAQNTDLQQHYRSLLEEITQLKPAVDKFFDSVLVMAEDEDLRQARLGMLSEVQGFLMHVADFTRIHIEG